MKHNLKRVFACVLAAGMAVSTVPSALVNASAESTYEASSDSSVSTALPEGEASSEESSPESVSQSGSEAASSSQDSVSPVSEETASDADDTTNVLTGYFKRQDNEGILSEDHNIYVRIKDKEDKKVFYDTDKVSFTEPDANIVKASENILQKAFPDGFTTLAGYDISLSDESGQKFEPGGMTEVSLFIPKATIMSVDGSELYHIKDDGTYEKIKYKVHEEDNLAVESTDSTASSLQAGMEKDGKIRYISFETDSFSPFFFVKAKEKAEISNAESDVKDTASDTAQEDKTSSPDSVSEAVASSDTGSVSSETPAGKAEKDASGKNGQKAESSTDSVKKDADKSQKPEDKVSDDKNSDTKNVKTEDKKNGLKSSFDSNKIVKHASARTPVTIDSLRTTLFAGAKKQSDGTYTWTANRPDSGHAFSYRISFSTSGEGILPTDSVQITIPKSVFKDRNGNAADKAEWSIPSSEDIASATNDDGTLNMDLIDSDSYYAYREEGDNYVIYNFRPVSAAQNNYIELAYELTKTTFNYVDMKENAFPCSMTVKYSDESSVLTKSAADIDTAIDTSAEITSTRVDYPGSRIKTWNSSWGTAVRPADPAAYYYLVFDVESDIDATQPYDFKLSDDELKSNLGDKMEILGYRMGGENGFSKTPSVKTNQTFYGTRYDQVLVGIPFSVYQGQSPWLLNRYKVSGNVTPVDKIDKATKATGQNSWSWTQPVFHEPTGSFNGYKRGDGAYRTYGWWSWYTQHYASDRDLHTGKWTRYDLEDFNGYSEDGNDTEPTLTKYDNFDFGSWIVGYPGAFTADGSTKTAANYWKKDVKYELTDEGVYLMNSDKALVSSDGSSARTIGNGIDEKVDGKTAAVKLTNNDFRIDKLEYSWYMRDASLDDETMTFNSKAPVYTDKDIITFEGKFNGSDTWTPFATYNIKTNTAIPDSDYVLSMDSGTITFKDGQDLTAYRVTTSNAHYYTELFTVPFYSLKNSQTVMNLLKGSRMMILLDNNEAKVYDSSNNTVLDAFHSDADYATASIKDSSLKKSVVSYGNNTKNRRYTITWRIDQEETVTSGEDGKEDYIPQQSGIFYDLLPAGSIFDPNSVDANAPYTVQTINNYQGSGQTMLIVKMTGQADHYSFTFDTIHSWNSIKDYGRNVHNPVAYETGNDSITKGGSDDGGTSTVDKVMMSDLSKKTGQTAESLNVDNSTLPKDKQVRKFLHASYDWDITSLMSASAGLTKKVKNNTDRQYSKETKTTINDDYSYELRYMNAPGAENKAKNIILFDSLENFGLTSKLDDDSSSDWHGTLDSIDTSQLKDKDIAPVVYISTKETLDPETDNDLSDSSVWTRVTDTTDLSKAKAVAIDASKKTDGSEFVLEPGDSIVAYLSMKTPDTAPSPREGETLPYAYNNVYVSDDLFNAADESSSEHYLIHYDYTKVSLTVSGALHVKKLNAKTGQPVPGITFRLYGTSDYGTAVDEKLVSGSDGLMNREKLEKGTYTLQETDATNDYLLDTTEHKVVIDGKGHCVVDGTDITESGKPFEISNKVRVHTDVSFKKVNSIFRAAAVKGAQYRLSGRSDYGTDVFMTAESEADGTVVFNNVEKGTYSLKEISAPDDYMLDTTEYTVAIDEDANFTMTKKSPEDVYNTTTAEVTKYSHTSNISDDGTQNGNYPNNASNADITGTDRGDTSKAHVVTIPGAKSIHVRITYETESTSYDWACVWEGQHPDYTAYNDYSSAIGGKRGDDSKSTAEFDVDGDSVTFGFRSDGSVNDYYGYYAVITGESVVRGDLIHAKGDPVPVDKENGIYTLTDEPLHYFTFTKKSSYDKSVLGGASFTLTGTSDRGTSVNMTAQSGDGTGTVKFSRLEPGTYLLKETEAPDGFYADGETAADSSARNTHVVNIRSDGTYMISGLIQENEGYVLYDAKKADKTVTVKKVWDDGITDHDPNELGITITNQVPDAANRNYTIIYDANGGTFGRGDMPVGDMPVDPIDGGGDE